MDAYQRLRQKKYCRHTYKFEHYLSEFRDVKSQIRDEMRRKHSQKVIKLHDLLYACEDHDQVVSLHLKDDPKNAITQLLIPDSCGNSPLLLIALCFDSKHFTPLIELVIAALKEIKLVHTNDQKQNIIHMLLQNKYMSLSDKIAVLQRIQKQEGSLYGSMLAIADTYDNIPLTYGLEILKRYRKDQFSDKIELVNLLVAVSKPAEFIGNKPNLKKYFKTNSTDGFEQAGASFITQFNDNPLKALIASKDVEMIKYLIEQRFFLLNGQTIQVSKKGEFKLGLSRFRFFYEDIDGKSSSLDIENLLFQHYDNEIKTSFAEMPEYDMYFKSHEALNLVYLLFDILLKSFDCGYSVEESFKRPIIRKLIEDFLAKGSVDIFFSNYSMVIYRIDLSCNSMPAEAIKLNLLKEVIVLLDSEKLNKLNEDLLYKMLERHNLNFNLVKDVFKVLWARICDETPQIRTKMVINFLNRCKSLRKWSSPYMAFSNPEVVWTNHQIRTAFTIVSMLDIDLQSKIVEARWIYQYLLRIAIYTGEIDICLAIIEKYGGELKEFDNRGCKEVLASLFGAEVKKQPSENVASAEVDEEKDYWNYEEEEVERIDEEIKKALSKLRTVKFRRVLEKLLDIGFSLPFKEEDMYSYSSQKPLLIRLYNEKGLQSINLPKLREHAFEATSVPASYEELLWLIKTLDIDLLDEASPFKSIDQLQEKDIIHLLHNVILKGNSTNAKLIERALTFKFKAGTIPYIAMTRSYHTLFAQCLNLIDKTYPNNDPTQYNEILESIFLRRTEEQSIPVVDLQVALAVGVPSLLRFCDRFGPELLCEGMHGFPVDTFYYQLARNLLVAYAEDSKNKKPLLDLLEILRKNSKLFVIPIGNHDIFDLLVFNAYKSFTSKDADLCGEQDESYEADENKGKEEANLFFEQYEDIPEFLDLLINSLGYRIEHQTNGALKLIRKDKGVYTEKHLLALRMRLVDIGCKVSQNLPLASICKDFKSFQSKTGCQLPPDMDAVSFYVIMIDWVLALLSINELSEMASSPLTLSLKQAFSLEKHMNLSGSCIQVYYLVDSSELWQEAVFLKICDDNYSAIKEEICPTKETE